MDTAEWVGSLVQLQRARGRAEVAVSLREGRVRLDRLYQEGCGKAILPRAPATCPRWCWSTPPAG